MKVSTVFTKKKFRILLSMLLLAVLLTWGIYMYKVSSKPPELYISTDNTTSVKCIKGGFNWNYFGRNVVADALSPTQMEYTEENTIYVNPSETLTFTNSNNYNMYNEDIKYYDKDLNEITLETVSDGAKSKTVSFNAPKQLGTYILSITMNYYNKGSVQYGVKVVVAYNVPPLEQYINTYVGDASKVSTILSLLPFGNYKNGIELSTSKEPYGITVNYSNINISQSELEFNTLALFTLVQNADTITYNIKNNDSTVTFNEKRDEIKQKYDLTIKDLKDYANGNNKNEYGFIQLKKLSRVYTLENAISDKCFVWKAREEYNREVIENFVSKVRNKENAFVRIVFTTIEGDIVIDDVEYKDNIFKLTIDSTRDKFSNPEDRVYKEKTYNNIKIDNGSDGDTANVSLYNGTGEMYQSTDVFGIYINTKYALID